VKKKAVWSVVIYSIILALLLASCTPSATKDEGERSTETDQTWEIVDEQSGQTATLTVDSSGRFTGSGWTGGGSQGIPKYDIKITSGRMSGTSMAFDVSASYNSGKGSISGKGSGKLNAAFPNATSASGTHSGNISDPLGKRSYKNNWQAKRIGKAPKPIPQEASDFDFDVDVSPHLVTTLQDTSTTITVTVKLLRGESQPVTLTTTDWQSIPGISVRLATNVVRPTGTTTLTIETTCDTPPDQYLFTVQGGTEGTFHTSQDAVTLKVEENPNCGPPAADKERARQHYSRGAAFADEGRFDEAISEFSKAIELDPDYALAYSSRCATYYRKGQYDQAIADCTEAILLDPNLAVAYYNRGLAYHERKEYDQAISDYTEAIQLDPDYAKAYNNRAWVYGSKGDWDRCIADCSKAIGLDADYVLAYNNRAWAYLNKGYWDHCIADCNKVIGLDSSNDIAYYNRGFAYKGQGRKDEAIADFQKFVTLTDDPQKVQIAEQQIEELSK